MADIAHTVPSVITTKDGSEFGFDRPGLQITQFDAGPTRSRDWLGYNLRTYDLDPSLWQSGTTALQQWSAFWHHIGGGSECGYIVEPVSETHRDLVCGGLGDASQTTFPIPVVAPTAVTVFVDGVPQEAAAYTIHSAANLYPTDAGTLPSSTDDVAVEGSGNSIGISSGVASDGLTCAKITAAGTAPALAVPKYASGHKCAVTVADTYTAVCPVLATAASNKYKLTVRYYDVGGGYLSADTSAAMDAAVGVWTVLSSEVVADASAVYATASVVQNATEADVFYVGGFALNPGDYTRWHLPSQSPGLIEFAAAPAAGARITATATGCRVSRCRFEPGSSWRVSSAGHAASRSIRAVEVIEV